MNDKFNEAVRMYLDLAITLGKDCETSKELKELTTIISVLHKLSNTTASGGELPSDIDGSDLELLGS